MSQTERDFLDEYADADAEAETPEEEVDTEVEVNPDEEATSRAQTPTEATPAEETDKEGPVPYKAMKAEREKRQERDRRIAELEDELRRVKAPREKPRQEPEQAAPEHENTLWKDTEAYIASRISKMERKHHHRFLVAVDDHMREAHSDYDEVIDKVKEYAQTNPAAMHQIMAASNPAKAGYQFGKKLIELQQM